MSRKLTDKESIPAVINDMTLEEKASLITGMSVFRTCGIEHLGIPPVLLLDGGTGINFMQLYQEFIYQATYKINDNEEENSNKSDLEGLYSIGRILPYIGNPSKLSQEDQQILTMANSELNSMKPEGKEPGCFPPGMLLGATWDPETVYVCAKALGKEANAYKIDVLLGTPNVNLHRDPLNGRLFEGYSEDPCLVAKLAPQFVKGIQGQGVAANVKHFAANNQETERMGINEHIPVRALHELYFPGFRACVQEGGVKTVMSAYNKINGKACTENEWLLTEVLRNQWGFDGFVVSDWGAAYDQVEAAKAGNDLVMPGPRSAQPLIDAVKAGRLSESVLDKCIENFLEILIEMPVMKGRKYTDIDTDFSKRAAYKAVAEGAVLLKNKGEVLPLNKSSKVSFFGKNSRKFIESGGGSAEVWTDLSSNLYDSTIEKIGSQLVSFEEINIDTEAVIITVGAKGQEGSDRPDMDIDLADREMLLRVIGEAKASCSKIVVVLNISGPVGMMDWINDVDAVLCVFFPGMEGGHAAADILFGDLNPSGKLPLTFPKYYRDCPTYGNFPGENGEVWYGEGIYVGYRYYDFKGIEPLFPFGYGLSYTSFEISDINLESSIFDMDKGKKFNVKVKVKNTGKMAGKEVVQLYIEAEKSMLKKPPKELKAFKKIALKPGEEKEIIFELGKDDLASFDTGLNQWTAEPGYYKILIGNSSRNITLEGRFKAVGENPYSYGLDSIIGRLFNDIRAVDVIRKQLAEYNIDPMDIVSNDMIFFPSTKFSEIWEKSFVPLLKNKTTMEIEIIIDQICKELKGIDVTDDTNKLLSNN
ncbi:glycoside hydrolase family 3 C-terminal domain-containing protein [Pseudobacteroides cellulosolvens]|uniref:Beta-glucosidase n=1 Tax=Pseudobacteroides cellulosolvens ATCC 35603 = DSM 2933 TaxID=398512 RepID=A0A0L6JTV6_9FIRM|nr:glycoside hydrolase family 3 N-terminal domain-containing protein [Pseudobacteroides cellulosolvens]KNY28852.1 Beta-glucosidase [Pseudobacteroides cellulosolvens ATCC 35603 = DSM 2933]